MRIVDVAEQRVNWSVCSGTSLYTPQTALEALQLYNIICSCTRLILRLRAGSGQLVSMYTCPHQRNGGSQSKYICWPCICTQVAKRYATVKGTLSTVHHSILGNQQFAKLSAIQLAVIQLFNTALTLVATS